MLPPLSSNRIVAFALIVDVLVAVHRNHPFPTDCIDAEGEPVRATGVAVTAARSKSAVCSPPTCSDNLVLPFALAKTDSVCTEPTVKTLPLTTTWNPLSTVSKTASAVVVPSGATTALAVTVVLVFVQYALSNSSLRWSRFCRDSSIKSPREAPVAGSWSKRGTSLLAVCSVPLASKNVPTLPRVNVMAGPVPLFKVFSPAKSRLKVGRTMAPDPLLNSDNVGARIMRREGGRLRPET